MPARKGRKVAEQDAAEQERFQALEELLVSLGWDVTVSRTLEGRGGACVVRGRPRVIVSRRVPLSERIEVLVETLRDVDLQGTFVRPDLRELLDGPAGSAEGP